MQYFLFAAAALLGALHLIAALSQIKEKKHTFPAMMLGSAMILLSAVFALLHNPLDWMLMLCGGLLICLAAIKNGKDSGHFHLAHHLVRGGIVLLLTIGMLCF